MKSRIVYIELKSTPQGHTDAGPARIGRVTFSRTGKTLYYRDKKFQSSKGREFCGNYYEVDSGNVYWISGPKKRGGDRHSCGSGRVEIDEDVREEYWLEIRGLPEKVNLTTT